MPRQEIGILACRILAIAMIGYGWLTAVYAVTSRVFYRPFDADDWRSTALASLIYAAYWLVCGAVIWRRAAIYARSIFNDDDELPVAPSVSSHDVLAVAYCVVGIWLIVPALTELLRITAEVGLYAAASTGPDDRQITFNSLLPRVVPEVVLLFSGLFVILRSQGLAEAVRRLRGLGRTESPPPTTEQ